MKPGHIVVSALVAVLGLAAVFVAQHWLDQRSHYKGAFVIAVPQVPMKTVVVADRPLRFGTLRAAGSVEAAAPRRVTLSDLGPAYEIYADAQEDAEETAVELLAKNVESGFESRRGFCVNRGFAKYAVLCWGPGFKPIDTGAMPFDPNARVGVIRGTRREEHRIPNQDGAAEAEVAGPDAKVEVEVDPVAAVVKDGMQAMSISIRDVHGVTGFLLHGDRVDVMLTRNHYPDILLQNVKILAIDQTTDERLDLPKTGRTATVEVNTVDAQKLTHAQTVGSLSLAMVEAIPFDDCASLYAFPCRADDLGPAFEIYSDPKDGYCKEETAVDPLAKNMEESFQAIENRISQMGQEFRGTQPIDTEAVPFDPNAPVGVIRGMSRQEYDVPKLNGEEFNRNIQPVYYECAAVRPLHPFAGRHPCFPE